MLVEASVGGKEIITPIEAVYSKTYDPLNHYLFTTLPFVQGMSIVAIKSIAIKK